MTELSDADFAACITALTGDDTPRVWSLIVTLFGDLAQAPGAEISSPALSRIFAPIGIKPQALRVALHRLRKDGWIDSRKSGRSSLYRLTPSGLEQSAAATPRIYAREVAAPALWHVLLPAPMPQPELAETAEALAARGYQPLTRGVFLGRGPVPGDCAGFFALAGPAPVLPDWLKSQFGPGDLAAAYRALHGRLDRVAALLPQGVTPGPLETATLRMLVVHSWRRLLLRHPDLPADFFPEGWPGADCRALTHRLLDRLPRPEPCALEPAPAEG
ncbi:PaaX family transcriptional regulator C-terminal domain-containing protein [Actibacterium sp. MT2.3-13A]|uniref:PaaX family transcriptional regulator C-terminal domain-containing protein n=1 Tax=Actibacterium sp. MT2.3-13A TaxID=2828332 RepID=UPI001BAE28F9|nr:PaaX family transcriptional regulator C-terminal domain-containing protein [Actibacterium sp. MT2.3-13A]